MKTNFSISWPWWVKRSFWHTQVKSWPQWKSRYMNNINWYRVVVKFMQQDWGIELTTTGNKISLNDKWQRNRLCQRNRYSRIGLKRNKKTSNSFSNQPYITTYNHQNTKIFKMINQKIPHLKEDSSMKHSLEILRIIKSKRPSKSPRNFLSLQNYQPPNNVTPNSGNCVYLFVKIHSIRY